VAKIFNDQGISGAKGRDDRPAFDALHRAVTRREIDLVAAWSVDRLGRSLIDLVTFLTHVHGAGVGLYLHQQGLDTTTPSGRAMFGMLGVFAEFERAIISAGSNAPGCRNRRIGMVPANLRLRAVASYPVATRVGSMPAPLRLSHLASFICNAAPVGFLTASA